MGFHGRSGKYHAFFKTIPLELAQWREVTSAGAVGDTTANGGVLSSNTTPIHGAEATSEAWMLNWAAGNSDIVQTSVSLPDDFDGGEDVLLELEVLTDNAGGGGIEAGTFSVLTSWNNGAQVTDTATDDVPAVTVHKITARISADDIPNDARFVNIQLVLGTHANDPVHLLSARLKYLPKTTS
jgi:hypothetical protein